VDWRYIYLYVIKIQSKFSWKGSASVTCVDPKRNFPKTPPECKAGLGAERGARHASFEGGYCWIRLGKLNHLLISPWPGICKNSTMPLPTAADKQYSEAVNGIECYELFIGCAANVQVISTTPIITVGVHFETRKLSWTEMHSWLQIYLFFNSKYPIFSFYKNKLVFFSPFTFTF